MEFYLVVDVSGSTVRHGFHEGWVRALPALAGELGPASLCVISYATEATVLVPLTPASELAVLPAPRPGGLSSLAAAFRLLATVVQPGGRVLVVADGLPTDRDDELLAARDKLDLDDAELHLAVPGDVSGLAVAGLRAQRHHLDLTSPAHLAATVLTAARQILRNP